MNLSPEQKQTVAQWVAAGDSLSTIQKKLADELKVSLTYRDVRFLIDDLNLDLKDAAPKVDTSDVSKAAPAANAGEKKGFLDKAKEKLGLGGQPDEAGEEPMEGEEEYDDLPPAGASNLSVAVDKVTLIPGALASGSVTFSDGVTAKWIVDQYGRPGLTEVSKPGYRPTAEDSRAFMQELSMALQKHGF